MFVLLLVCQNYFVHFIVEAESTNSLLIQAKKVIADTQPHREKQSVKIMFSSLLIHMNLMKVISTILLIDVDLIKIR